MPPMRTGKTIPSNELLQIAGWEVWSLEYYYSCKDFSVFGINKVVSLV
jgi:hypothetical protein